MPDYKKMYLHLFKEISRAQSILKAAQLSCIDLYFDTADDVKEILPLDKQEENPELK